VDLPEPDFRWTALQGRYVETARQWVGASLAGGGELSAHIVVRLDDFVAGAVMVPPSLLPAPLEFDNVGGRVAATTTEQVTARWFADLATRRTTLLVEDDLGRPGDPRAGEAAVLGTTLIRWMPLTPGGGAAAARLLRTGSSGYPLNAFLCAGDSADWDLSPAAAVAPRHQKQIALATVGIVTTVWDAECFLALTGAGDDGQPTAGHKTPV
jgi:hypothetical protein